MNRLLAIVLALFALLPHPALLVAALTTAPDCIPAEECGPACPCCPAGGGCACAEKEETPPLPQPPAPVRGADFHPVPALPPAENNLPAATVPRDKKAGVIPSASDRVRTLTKVRLHVRYCVFLI